MPVKATHTNLQYLQAQVAKQRCESALSDIQSELETLDADDLLTLANVLEALSIEALQTDMVTYQVHVELDGQRYCIGSHFEEDEAKALALENQGEVHECDAAWYAEANAE